jgi:serine/threonine protein kinase/formylglycine-generating enzyme required for sulfatase activity/dienelactone hydrolase
VIVDRWGDVERLFHEAMQLKPQERGAFLESIESDDIRGEVASLVASSGDCATSAVGAVIGDAAAAALSEPLTGSSLGHFRIVRPLGRGAMGEVYLAQDRKLGRQVALKLLPVAFQGDSERVRRFEREARAAAALNHPNIVTVHEVGDWEGQPFIATEFVAGETLGQRLSRGPISTMETLHIADQIAAALAAAHGAGIVHRDLKPANIMLRPDGIVKVVDFGLARLSRPAAEFAGDEGTTGTMTVPSRIMGTPHYMSPEQARGEVVDARSDLWSLGVVLYESLAGQRPFEAPSQMEVLAAVLSREPAPLRSLTRNVPSGLADLVARLLVKDREQRLSSAAEVAQVLKRFSETAAERKIRTRRRRWIAASAIVLLAIVAASGGLLYRWSKRQWARYEAIPLARTLADKGDYVGAYQLAFEVARYIPDDPALRDLWPEVSQWVSVHTEPPGAEVVWKQYAQLKAPWRKLGRTPLDKIRVPAGPIRVQMTMAGYEPVEVAVDRVTSMGELPTSTYDFKLVRSGSALSHMIRVPDRPGGMEGFEIDRYEVTNREFKEFVSRGGYRNRDYWKVPFVNDGHAVSWDGAMAAFVDPTGRPGPATWEAGTYPPGQDSYPVSGVSWYEAAAYAEFAGKSLPTVAHWLRGSNLEAVASDLRFLIPLSNFEGAHPEPVGASGAVNSLGLYDVAGNVREWCWNETGGRRNILGGAWTSKANEVYDRDNEAPFDRSATNGFRCVRYTDPSRALRDFGGSRPPERWPDYYKVTPVSDGVFEIYRGLYAYTAKPLNPVVESVDESSDLWRREKIRFQAPYGNEQVVAYLFLPKQGKPPYQCVLYMADGGTLRPGSGETIRPESYILRSGRAMLYPIYKGTLDRYMKISPDPVTQRDMTIAWHKDLSSSIDYLQNRPDIDAARLGYMGHSMGTRYAPMMLATEPRIKVAILLAGAMRPVGALPEADPVNFLPRITIPVLHVTGKYDSGYPVDLAQKPFFDLLGTPPKDKRHVILPVGHAILVPEVRTTVVREVLDWLDRYLGLP